jgi:predicted TIM-barrel fold metal-dependent hydrolase
MSEQAWVEISTTAYLRLGRTGDLRRPDTYLADMDRSGVDVAFLYPTFALLIEGFAPLEPALGSAFARAYNTWLHGFCSRDPERLRGVGLISLHDPPAMVPELERVAALGWKAVLVRPNPIGGRLLSHPAYEPFWGSCERLDMAVAIHDGTHAYVPSAGADRFETRFAMHACSHPMEQMMALLCLIEGGVFERHPALRVASLEAGCGWLPYWLWRLDEEYHYMGGEVAERVRRKPSEYVRRQYFATIEPGEPYLAEAVRLVGDGVFLFGTDYPHPEHGTDVVGEALALRSHLREDQVKKILWDNSARFYGLER